MLGQKTRKHGPSQSVAAYKTCLRAITNLENEIDAIEKEIQTIVQNDSDLNDNYKLITSIKGIGPVIANNLIIKTEVSQQPKKLRPSLGYALIQIRPGKRQ